MKPETKNLIKLYYSRVPDNIKKAIQDANLTDKFNKIADKNSLMLDQNGSLQTETMLVLLGIEPTKDFIANLKVELDIPSSKAEAIAKDVNEQIFESIKDTLRDMQIEEESEQENQNENIATKKADNKPNPLQNTPTPQPATRPKLDDSQMSRDELLKIIEDPEAITDHMLTKPTDTPPSNPKPQNNNKPTHGYSSDPYREQI